MFVWLANLAFAEKRFGRPQASAGGRRGGFEGMSRGALTRQLQSFESFGRDSSKAPRRSSSATNRGAGRTAILVRLGPGGNDAGRIDVPNTPEFSNDLVRQAAAIPAGIG
jgi:hypothetical protein